jgi:hypothetical protein
MEFSTKKDHMNVSLDEDLKRKMTELKKYGVNWSLVINSDCWQHVKDAKSDLKNLKTPGYTPKFLEFMKED